MNSNPAKLNLHKHIILDVGNNIIQSHSVGFCDYVHVSVMQYLIREYCKYAIHLFLGTHSSQKALLVRFMPDRTECGTDYQQACHTLI